MKEIYDDLDKHKDLVVKRKLLVQKLRADIRIVRILHLPAVYISGIDKSLNLERAIYRVEKEELIGDKEEKMAKEFITWH